MSTRTASATVVAAAACVALWWPAAAPGAVTIGGDTSRAGSPEVCSLAGCEAVQLSLVSARTVAPFDGVVVRWRVNGSTGPLALRVVRPGPSGFTFSSTSPQELPATTGLESFAARQRIQAGDYVGVELRDANARIGVATPNTAGDVIATWSLIPDGQAASPDASGPGFTLGYSADVEPDADHDGYGDETQDSCPSDASTHGACPPPPAPPPGAGMQSGASTPAPDRTAPVLSARARRARLSKRRSISFFVASSENATGLVTATVRLPKLVRFASRTLRLQAGARTMVTLRLSSKGAAIVRKALTKGRRLKVIVSLSVEDAAGNPSAAKLALTLRR